MKYESFKILINKNSYSYLIFNDYPLFGSKCFKPCKRHFEARSNLILFAKDYFVPRNEGEMIQDSIAITK